MKIEKPELTPERQKVVDEIIQILAEQNPTFHEAYDMLEDVKRELQYRSTHLRL